METCSLSSSAEGAVYSGPSVFVISFTYNLIVSIPGLCTLTYFVWIRPIQQLEDSILKIQEAYKREHVSF